MNRMIKLFQAKSDLAFEKYLLNRQGINPVAVGSPEWNAAVNRGFALDAETKTWQRAADLLRKEELNK
jgi:hypothetical protein